MRAPAAADDYRLRLRQTDARLASIRARLGVSAPSTAPPAPGPHPLVAKTLRDLDARRHHDVVRRVMARRAATNLETGAEYKASLDRLSQVALKVARLNQELDRKEGETAELAEALEAHDEVDQRLTAALSSHDRVIRRKVEEKEALEERIREHEREILRLREAAARRERERAEREEREAEERAKEQERREREAYNNAGRAPAATAAAAPPATAASPPSPGFLGHQHSMPFGAAMPFIGLEMNAAHLGRFLEAQAEVEGHRLTQETKAIIEREAASLRERELVLRLEMESKLDEEMARRRQRELEMQAQQHQATMELQKEVHSIGTALREDVHSFVRDIHNTMTTFYVSPPSTRRSRTYPAPLHDPEPAPSPQINRERSPAGRSEHSLEVSPMRHEGDSNRFLELLPEDGEPALGAGASPSKRRHDPSPVAFHTPPRPVHDVAVQGSPRQIGTIDDQELRNIPLPDLLAAAKEKYSPKTVEKEKKATEDLLQAELERRLPKSQKGKLTITTSHERVLAHDAQEFLGDEEARVVRRAVDDQVKSIVSMHLLQTGGSLSAETTPTAKARRAHAKSPKSGGSTPKSPAGHLVSARKAPVSGSKRLEYLIDDTDTMDSASGDEGDEGDEGGDVVDFEPDDETPSGAGELVDDDDGDDDGDGDGDGDGAPLDEVSEAAPTNVRVLRVQRTAPLIRVDEPSSGPETVLIGADEWRPPRPKPLDRLKAHDTMGFMSDSSEPGHAKVSIDVEGKRRREREQAEKERRLRETQELEDQLERERQQEEERRAKLAKAAAEKERLEKERLAKEKADKERLEKEKKERLKQERLEKERLEKERLEKERLEKERLEKERLAKERLAKERLAKEKEEEEERLRQEELENERRLERDRQERERQERARREKQKARKAPAPTIVDDFDDDEIEDEIEELMGDEVQEVPGADFDDDDEDLIAEILPSETGAAKQQFSVAEFGFSDSGGSDRTPTPPQEVPKKRSLDEPLKPLEFSSEEDEDLDAEELIDDIVPEPTPSVITPTAATVPKPAPAAQPAPAPAPAPAPLAHAKKDMAKSLPKRAPPSKKSTREDPAPASEEQTKTVAKSRESIGSKLKAMKASLQKLNLAGKTKKDADPAPSTSTAAATAAPGTKASSATPALAKTGVKTQDLLDDLDAPVVDETKAERSARSQHLKALDSSSQLRALKSLSSELDARVGSQSVAKGSVYVKGQSMIVKEVVLRVASGKISSVGSLDHYGSGAIAAAIVDLVRYFPGGLIPDDLVTSLEAKHTVTASKHRGMVSGQTWAFWERLMLHLSYLIKEQVITESTIPLIFGPVAAKSGVLAYIKSAVRAKS